MCREYGLPAVTNVSGVTTAVVEGEQIELDAYKGLVKRHVPIAPGQLQTNQ
ncbi:PEP-utilizing enzyme [Petrachloros mirabilis]